MSSTWPLLALPSQLGSMRQAAHKAQRLFVVFALYVAFGIYKEPIAEAQARDFCSSVKIGDPAEATRERALQAGALSGGFAKWHEGAKGQRQLIAIFVGFPPFSRHICDITATDVVVSASYTYSD